MNFPDTLLFRVLYAFINTPGIGGIAVGLLGFGISVVVGLMLKWIAGGGDVDEPEAYAYPSPAFHRHEAEVKE